MFATIFISTCRQLQIYSSLYSCSVYWHVHLNARNPITENVTFKKMRSTKHSRIDIFSHAYDCTRFRRWCNGFSNFPDFLYFYTMAKEHGRVKRTRSREKARRKSNREKGNGRARLRGSKSARNQGEKNQSSGRIKEVGVGHRSSGSGYTHDCQ